ncbi:hypothetical protein CAI21_02870 [Alkalilimnicola ehrlichii]|uniref:Biopolymer transporter ExbD n=1 Tax=Alkalilimnicola ehrlichii TaxID=351052 RepID=A0A3E0X334_9GAMM|nr:biopolymer transporter ExbD [Alkalilimnicola ehrlichii]RFA30936.1 hypothetical protein CAI21_02870 [Alkalilimnicola ehrlichii]RFA38886.1 hypothetical protein CAL65_03005 [Alkalilimnicola ehrlichii]
MVNSADVQEIPSSRQVELPESVAETAPRETVIVHVAADEILVQDRPLASTDGIREGSELIIEPLRDALSSQLNNLPPAARQQAEVTILGDRSIPYDVLRRVMATCTEAGFSQVSLAVTQTAPEGGDSL